jgi:hypothetical protein
MWCLSENRPRRKLFRQKIGFRRCLSLLGGHEGPKIKCRIFELFFRFMVRVNRCLRKIFHKKVLAVS